MTSTVETEAHAANAAQAVEAGRFSLQIHPDREDWYAVEEWMLTENWDPGWGDAQAVTASDRDALMIGLLDGKPISAISLLCMGDEYAFLGNYIVRPDYRGRGFGLATWNAALSRAGERVIGLEAVPEQVGTYGRAGFAFMHTTIGYQGIIRRLAVADDGCVRPIESADRDAVVALDAACSPFPRPGFLAAWMASSAARTLIHCEGSEINGFGVIRPSFTGYRLGPLVAHTPAVALRLYDALTAGYAGERVHLNAPEPNRAAADLAGRRGLARVSHTVRMYSKPVRPTAVGCNYSVSLAWG